MKKLTKVLMVGALALTGFAGVGAFNASPAAAAEKPAQLASNPYDPWGIDNTWILDTQIPMMPTEYRTYLDYGYKSGRWFTILLPYKESHFTNQDQVKIFRVSDDGSGELSRIKTIFPTEVYDDGWKTVWQTQFNDNYPAGKYVAVSYIDGKHLKSNYFTVNK